MPSPARVAQRHLSRLPWTIPYLKGVIKAIESQVGSGMPGAGVLESLIKRHGWGDVEPFPVSELVELMEWKGAWPEELEILRAARPPRRQRPKKYTVSWPEAYLALEKAAGKPLVLINITMDTDQHLIPAMIMWTKAIESLSKYRAAWKLWQSEVRKLRLMGRGTGPEASWQASGVLYLNLTKTPRHVGSAREILIHELGHALEDKLDLTVSPWDDTPYGQPPYVSSYADTNASEDFAETFLVLMVEPSRLKNKAPAKYIDMRSRV